jgi:hypothetical protein
MKIRLKILKNCYIWKGKETDAHVEMNKHIFTIFQFVRAKSQKQTIFQIVEIRSSPFTCFGNCELIVTG